MNDIKKLLQKQARIAAQIEHAKAAARRKARIGDLAEKAGALDLSDEQILSALLAAVSAAEATSLPQEEGDAR